MENCLLNGEIICALDVRNKYNIEDYDLKRKWKKAQYNNELICEDCGNLVELRAGDVKIPHFAHRRGLLDPSCYYNAVKETEEHRKAKSLIYSYFKEKYPEALIQPTKKQPNNRRTDIYVEQGSSRLAIEFQRFGLKISDWDIRHEDYEKLGIVDLWILSSKIYLERVHDFDFLTQVLLHESRDNTAKFLDVDSGIIRLLRQIEYADSTGIIRKRKFFSQTYNLFNINISLDGKIESDFEQKYAIEKEEYVKNCEEVEAKEILQSNENRKLDMFRQREREWFNSIQANKKKKPPFSNVNDSVGLENKQSVVENVLTPAERELEVRLASRSNRSSEFRDYAIIQGWVNQFNRILEVSDKYKENDQYNRLKSWCELTFQGHRNNGYIAAQNAERLELRLKLLSDIVSVRG